MIKEKIDKYQLFNTTGFSHGALDDPETAHLVVHHNQVLGSNLVPGLHVDVKELEDGIDAELKLDEETIVKNPVHICFGMMPKTGVQRIKMKVDIGKNSEIFIYAHCTFPFAVDIQHIMDAEIHIGEGARYEYFERHMHDDSGGVKVYPKAVVRVDKNAGFKTEFELLKGRVGLIDIDYQVHAGENSNVEMTARVNGTGDDVIKIRETAYLEGEGATGALLSRIAARDDSKAEVYNKLRADAPYARGHVDCKEIIQGRGTATAIPVVEVMHPRAHVTHEAAIGSVDSKELETLMSRGLDEDQAVDLIIQGLLSR